MKLNQSQFGLLKEAASNKTGQTFTHHGCFTGSRSGSFGSRKSEAACKLRDAGLFEHVRSCNSRDIINSGFTTVHSYESVWRITEAGRKALG